MTRVPQGVAAQVLSDILNLPFVESSFVFPLFVGVVFRDWGTVRKRVIFVGFLWVSIGSDLCLS